VAPALQFSRRVDSGLQKNIENTTEESMAHTPTRSDWQTEEEYWREQYRNRPYFEAGRDFDYYRPGYRFAYDARDRYQDDEWDNVEANLQRDWDRYDDRGQTTWQQIKNAVRDGWDRITGKHA
jgi:hypothetical protein